MRTKNKFGRRFISLQELCDYVVDLGLSAHRLDAGFMEFLEREGMLCPVARVRFSHEMLRRLTKEEWPERNVFEPMEPDGPALDAAIELIQTLRSNTWQDSRLYGESDHPLDVVTASHSPFVVKDFSSETFTPWEDLRPLVYEHGERERRSDERFSPTYYHYWQVFWLATILRAGATIHYPIDDNEIGRALLMGNLETAARSQRLSLKVNLEARHELRALRRFEAHFEMVGYFEAYTHHALQVYVYERNNENGRLSQAASRSFARREREIAHAALQRSSLSASDIIEFIGMQTEWWIRAARHGPTVVADEYKKNITTSLTMHRLATRVSPRTVVDRIGHRGGYHRPILEVIFPDWTEEQRDLTVRSLSNWARQNLNSLPSPFPVTDADLRDFCDWLEVAGLHQYYWHFRRLVDIGQYDDPVDRAATAAEAVGFANLCEMIANKALENRGETEVARKKTLSPKLGTLFNSNGPVDLTAEFRRFKNLTQTREQSVAQRLAQIDRIRRSGGNYAPVIRVLLKLLAIRNEGSHLGLLRYDRVKIIRMVEALSLASLMIWRAR